METLDQYFINQNGQQTGPYDVATLKYMAQRGQLSADAVYWQEGNDEWLPVNIIVDIVRKGGSATGGSVLMTTEMIPPFPVKDRLGIVGCEKVVGVNLFKDMAASMRDLTGGNSITLEKQFESARYAVIANLKSQTSKMGGNGLIAVSLNHSVISARESMMILVTGTATAVVFESTK